MFKITGVKGYKLLISVIPVPDLPLLNRGEIIFCCILFYTARLVRSFRQTDPLRYRKDHLRLRPSAFFFRRILYAKLGMTKTATHDADWNLQ